MSYAPDGSPVALYAALPPLGEPELIHDAVPAGAEILELGAGAGRITHRLLELGHSVVAVDESREMLALVVGAETMLADIETLDLDRRFPVVVLASNFINHPDAARVRAFLACCARHVEANGQVLLQGYPLDWEPDTAWREIGGIRARLRSHELDGTLLRGEMEYVLGGESVRHAFEARLRTEPELDRLLADAGLRPRRFLDERRSWIEAVPGDAEQKGRKGRNECCGLPPVPRRAYDIKSVLGRSPRIASS
jgi:SAM-dependent methyltransferase